MQRTSKCLDMSQVYADGAFVSKPSSNVKTAKALGLTLPLSLVDRGDAVIE
jgi:hypothetical protein